VSKGNRSELSERFDDIARIVASPIPRREAIKQLGKTLGGGMLAVLGFGMGSMLEAQRAGACPIALQFYCSNVSGAHTCCVLHTQQCCTDTGAYCCSTTQSCCGGTCCESNQTCCKANGSAICCAPREVCCNGQCCQPSPSASTPCQGAICS
jgi:hypothetical protein